MFSLYTSPIGQIASQFNISLQQYADDTQLYFASTANELSINLTRFDNCLFALHSWFCHNGLALNSDKSESIIFGTRQRLRTFPVPPDVTIAGSVVPLTSHIKTLGVTLDNNLTFTNHVSSVSKSAFYHIRALRHIRGALTTDMAKAVATSLIQTRLDYANSILYGTSEVNIGRLQRIQNSAARIVLNQHNRSTPSSQLLSQLHWLPVSYRIKFKLATITYKTLSVGQPSYLLTSLNPYHPTRSLRSSDQQLLNKPNITTEFGRRAFSYAAPDIWNDLPLNIRLSPSADSFKRHLKTFYFTQSSHSLAV